MSTAVLQFVAALLGATTFSIGPWTVHSDRDDEPLLRFVRNALPQAQAETEDALGLTLQGRPTLVLCGTRRSFERATPGVDHRHTLGVTYPGRQTVFVNGAAIESRLFSPMGVTLRHEIAHLLVGEAERRGRHEVPLWFNEGVAVWSSGKLPRYDVRAYRRAVASGQLRPVEQLKHRFPSDPRQRGIAYEQSESVVRYIADRHGAAAVRRILQGVASGRSFPAAVRDAIGQTVAALEADWRDSQEPALPWLVWLVNTFTLFSVMSLLALVAFWVYWRRRRRRYAEWDMEENYYGSGGIPWQ